MSWLLCVYIHYYCEVMPRKSLIAVQESESYNFSVCEKFLKFCLSKMSKQQYVSPKYLAKEIYLLCLPCQHVFWN